MPCVYWTVSPIHYCATLTLLGPWMQNITVNSTDLATTFYTNHSNLLKKWYEDTIKTSDITLYLLGVQNTGNYNPDHQLLTQSNPSCRNSRNRRYSRSKFTSILRLIQTSSGADSLTLKTFEATCWPMRDGSITLRWNCSRPEVFFHG